MSRQFYTVAEVNARLPRVRRAAEEVREGSGRLKRLSDVLYPDSRPEPDTTVDRRYLAGLEQVLRGVETIGDLGGELKDLSRGLVDFPSLREGRKVWLCWMPGEERVGYWHDLDAGFAGRSAIDDESAFQGDGEAGGAAGESEEPGRGDPGDPRPS